MGENKLRRALALGGVIVALCVCAGARAQVTLGVSAERAERPEPSAADIAAKVVRTEAFAWDGARTHMRMVLTDASGEKRERAMDVVGRKRDGLFQTLVKFLAPTDIAGTTFLMIEHSQKHAEQYVYLPSFKRTRRIVGREREGSFMGSDFTYADMQRIDPQHAVHRRLPDERFGSELVFVVETQLSSDAKLPYGRVVTWIRKSDYIALRTRFYSRDDQLLKTLYSRRIKQVDGKPVVVEARMQNQQNQHVTELYIDAIERRDDLTDVDFTPAALDHM